MSHGRGRARAELKEDARTRPRILLRRDDPVAQMMQQNKHLERQVGRVRYLAAERATVVVQAAGGVRKLCSLQFSRKGGVFAHFPYFESKNGLLNTLGYDAPARGSTTISFAEGGKTVSHDVKYSHPRHGNAHFSQDGKIVTRVRRPSYPLTGPIGHLWQLGAYGLSGFETLDGVDRKRAHLVFVFTGAGVDDVQVAVEWRRISSIDATIERGGTRTGPNTTIAHKRTGQIYDVWFLGAPDGFPQRDHVMMVSVVRVERPTGLSGRSMIFMGGWDPHEVARLGQTAPNTGCLFFIYPFDPNGRAGVQLESGDFVQPMPAEASPDESSPIRKDARVTSRLWRERLVR